MEFNLSVYDNNNVGGNAMQKVWCGGTITNITRSCDCLTILVTTMWPDSLPHILFFDTRSLCNAVCS